MGCLFCYNRSGERFRTSATSLALMLIGLLFLTGCMHRNPLVVPGQAKLIQGQDKYLRPYAEPIQDKIRTAGTTAALVVTPVDHASAPLIIPADDPILATQANLDAVTTGGGCIFVFKSSLALTPQPLSCKLLVLRASGAMKAQSHEAQQDAELAEIRDGITGLSKQAATLQSAINSANTEIKADQTVLGAAMTLVRFHEAQLEKMERSLDLLAKGYKRTTEVVGKNNQQIDTMIADLNKAFAQIQNSLSQMKQKLGTIQ